MSTVVITKINNISHYVRRVKRVGDAFLFEIGQNVSEAHNFGSIKAAAEAITGCINNDGRTYKISHTNAHDPLQAKKDHQSDTRFH